MKRFVPVFIFIAVVTSCQLQRVTVDLYSPPKLEYPPELRSLMVTSRYVPATGIYEDVQWGSYESVDSVKWALAESLVDSLAARIVEGNHFLVKIRHYPRMLRNNTDSLPEALPWEGMVSLAKKEFVRGILVLEGFDIRYKEETVSIPDKGFIATLRVEVILAIRVYEPEKRRLVDEKIYTFSKSFKSTGKSPSEARSDLPDTHTSAVFACSQAAADYAELIRPDVITGDRVYYSKGDSLMRVADSAVQAGKWGRAEAKWNYEAYNAKDSLTRAKASFNMALACEMDGRLNQAVGFARRSEMIRPDKKTREYITLLEAKLAEYRKRVENGEIIRNW